MESNMSNSDQRLDQCHILQLNDDCFYEIYKFLPPIDWCSLRETCTRLRAISDYWFNRQSERFDLHPEIVYGAKDVPLSLDDSKRLIRNFGQFMTTLSIDRLFFIDKENPESLLPLIDRYCIALKNLGLFGIDFIPRRLVSYDRLLSKLHRIKFYCSEWQWNNTDSFQFWMVRCTSLKKLKLWNLVLKGCSLDHRFESLESFAMIGCYSVDPDSVAQFYSKNQQLKEIKLLHNKFRLQSNNLLKDAVVTLPNLESLSLLGNTNVHRNVIPATTSALRNLTLDLESIEDDAIINRLFTDLAAHDSVKNVSLFSNTLSDAVFEHLCKLKAVQILTLSSAYDLNEINCRKLATELPAVSEIHLYDCIKFNQIKEFVTHAANLKRIVLGQSFWQSWKVITVEMILSLAEVRKEKENQEILLIFLDASYLANLLEECERKRMSEMLSSYSNVIQLLPLEEEHINYYAQI